MVRRKFINTNGLRLYAFFTTVPIGSPSTILHKFPGVSMSNTTMGRSCSFHMVKAVRSITLSLRSYTSSKVIVENFVAVGSFSGSAV